MTHFSIQKKYFFFILITFITVFIHIFSIIDSNKNRDLIWEPDDTYHEIIKSSNFINCLDKKCIGLQNLSNYIDDQYQEGKESIKEILNHHISFEYHLIKSLILGFFNFIFDDWEKSHLVTTLITTSLLVIIINTTILILFKIDVALISSIVLMPFISMKFGYHFSQGSDELASVFGLILIYLVNKKQSHFFILYYVFALLSILSHPIGLFMVLFSVLYHFFYFKKINIDFLIRLISIPILFSIIYFLEIRYYDSNTNLINVYNQFNFSINSFLEIIKSNIIENLFLIYDLNSLLSLIIYPIFIFIYFKNIRVITNKYYNLLPLLLSILIIFCLSLIHTQPHASIIIRMQQFILISIVPFISIIFLELFNDKNILNLKLKYFVIFLTSFLFLLSSFNNFNNLFASIKSNQETLHLDIKDKEIAKYFNNKEILDPVLFYNGNTDFSVFKAIFYNILLNGGYDRNIFIYDFMSKKQKDNFFNKYNEFDLISLSPILLDNLKYKIKFTCYQSFKMFKNCIDNYWYGGNRIHLSDLLVRNKDEIIFNKNNKYEILINTYGKEIKLKKDEEYYFIKNNNFEWVNLGLLQQSSIQFTIENGKFSKITGLKISDNQNSFWPWNSDIEMIHINSHNKKKIKLDTSIYRINKNCNEINLIDDEGSIIIFNVKCKN
jgi:hypothetical protein